MSTRVAYVQLAVCADSRRGAGCSGLCRGRGGGGAQLAVYGETARLAVPLNDAVEGAGRWKRGHTAVDSYDTGTRRAADDHLSGLTSLISDGGRRTQTAKRAA